MEKKNKKAKNNKNKKGFTLIELLAVIVILGLLLAIAIPSITKYITQSRKKTVVSSIDGYISSTVNSVNDQDYKFTTPNTIYAIPIECISVEKGGTNPFGEWLQANKDYWAYVLVQYDSTNFSYTYGFTFKDSAGYGMYPTIQSEINPKSSTQIKTGLELTKPTSGKAIDITTEDNWNGFKVDSETNLVVLEAESEGTPGNEETTCTLCQKGSNYEQAEQEKAERKPTLTNLIKKHNTVVSAKPTLTTTSSEAGDASGLYISTDTNSGNPTYYFRGNVTNNYVSFANLIWKVIRINEDGTVRLILNSGVNNQKYKFNNSYNSVDNMYYSNSDTAKPIVDSWYKTNIVDKGFDDYVVMSDFCEEAKVKGGSNFTTGNATMTLFSEYTPNFRCSTDGNEKGILSSKVGLITYDEVVFAGGYYELTNNKYYLYNGGYYIWTMTPAGMNYVTAQEWRIESSGKLNTMFAISELRLRPVINLKANVRATGTGTSDDPYVIKTN